MFLIITTMTETAAAEVVTTEGCWVFSGHRDFMISVAGQQGLDGSTEPCWGMESMKATAGEQMA